MWGQEGLPSRELENAKAPRQTPGTFQRLAGPKQGGSGEREVWRVSPRVLRTLQSPDPTNSVQPVGEASLRLLPGPVGGSHRVKEVQASRYARQQKE